MVTLRWQENIYYCFKIRNTVYKKYIQAKTIYYFDSKGRVIKELDYYKWKKKLELSAIRIYCYDNNRLIYEEVRHNKEGITEKKFHIYDGNRKVKKISIEFESCDQNRVLKAIVTDYIYDRYGRLEKDIAYFEPKHYLETRYFYQKTKHKLTKKIDYVQLGKANRWWTTYYYDENGRLKKELVSYKKGPLVGKSFARYYYVQSQRICINSDGERTVTIFNKNQYSSKCYDSNGALTGFTKMKEEDGFRVVRRWEYACDCYGVVAYPVFLSVTKYKYR